VLKPLLKEFVGNTLAIYGKYKKILCCGRFGV